MYTYKYVEPGLPPFKTVIKRTRGKFSHVTEPMGPFHFRYAVFVNHTNEVLIPLHDLTTETRRKLKFLYGQNTPMLR